MNDIDTKKEQLEEMRQDMLEEQRLRENFHYAVTEIEKRYKLQSAVDEIRNFMKELRIYGWNVDLHEIFEWY